MFTIADYGIPDVYPRLDDLVEKPLFSAYLKEDIVSGYFDRALFNFMCEKKTGFFDGQTNNTILSVLSCLPKDSNSFEKMRKALELIFFDSIADASVRKCLDLSVLSRDLKNAPVNQIKYEYTSHLQRALDHIEFGSIDRLMDDFDDDLWLIDDLDVAQKVILLGIEHVWTSSHVLLRTKYIKMLLRILHYAHEADTQKFVSDYLRCYFAGLVPNAKPYLEEYDILKKMHYNDKSIIDFLTVFDAPIVVDRNHLQTLWSGV